MSESTAVLIFGVFLIIVGAFCLGLGMQLKSEEELYKVRFEGEQRLKEIEARHQFLKNKVNAAWGRVSKQASLLSGWNVANLPEDLDDQP